jgi:hypothetical protein
MLAPKKLALTPQVTGGQEREVDWLLQKPEFCVICFKHCWSANLCIGFPRPREKLEVLSEN